MTLKTLSTPEQVAYVDRMLAEIRGQWELACAWDHLDPLTVQFNGFSDGNPYADKYHGVVEHYERYRREKNV